MSAHLTSRATRRRLVASGALAITLVLASSACSDDDEGRVVADVLEDDGLETQPDTPESTDTTAPVAQICEPETPIEVSADDKPVIEAPGGDRPTELVVDDITEGDGREVVAGDSLQVQYSGALFSDGTEFDTSWDDLMPLPVTVGSGGVIPGFDEGLLGMMVGGRRQITIPAEQGYGEAGSGDAIPPDSDLIFVVDVVQDCYPDPDAEAPVPDEGGDETTVPVEGGDETTVPDEGGDETTVPEDDATTTAPVEGDTTAPAEG